MYAGLIRNSSSLSSHNPETIAALAQIEISSIGQQATYVDPDLLNFQPVSGESLFDVEEKAIYNMRERLMALDELEASIQNHDLQRAEKGKELSAKRRASQNKVISEAQSDSQRKEELIRAMIARCVELTDSSKARFYLESCNWDLENAIQVYNGDKPSLEWAGKTNVIMVLPDRRAIPAQFDVDNVLWSMMPLLQKELQGQSFVVKRDEGSRPYTQDEMTNLTFKSAGLVPNPTVFVELYNPQQGWNARYGWDTKAGPEANTNTWAPQYVPSPQAAPQPSNNPQTYQTAPPQQENQGILGKLFGRGSRR